MRSVSIQTTTGVTTRPITKLYPLEVNAETTVENNTDDDRPSMMIITPMIHPRLLLKNPRRLYDLREGLQLELRTR